MTDPLAPFMPSIIAEPDADYPRLLAADYLDEPGPHHDPARAEFVRVQVEIARLGFANGCQQCRDYGGPCNTCERPDLEALCRRERALWRGTGRPIHHPVQWFEIPGWACMADVGLSRIAWTARDYAEIVGEVRRGFVSQITCTWADWLTHHKALLAACPIRRMNRAKLKGEVVTDRTGCVGILTADGPDDWRGDGLVRLTTEPDIEVWPITHGPPLVRIRKPLGPDQLGGNQWVRQCPVVDLLAAEWAGVQFKLPGPCSSWTPAMAAADTPAPTLDFTADLSAQ